MNDNVIRRYDMQVRVVAFYNDNAPDFNAFAKTTAQELEVLVNASEAEAAEQAAGFGESGQQHAVKDTIREDLRGEMSDMSRTSKSMEYQFDGISDKFRFRRNSSDAVLLARGRAFHSESLPYEADFINYDMPADFRATLNALCDAFEASFSDTAGARAEHVAATADLASNNRQGMVKVRILDGIMRNKYANDPGKLAAWLSASHVEKAPKSIPKPPVVPTPPTVL